MTSEGLEVVYRWGRIGVRRITNKGQKGTAEENVVV